MTSPRHPIQTDSSDPSMEDTSLPTEADLRRLAIVRLKKKRSFRSHLVVYVVINLLFWAGWIIGGLVDRWIFPWPIFPTVFWGLFVLGWARDLYGMNAIGEDQIRREIEQLRQDSRANPTDVFELHGRSRFDWPSWPFDDRHGDRNDTR